MCTTVEGDQVDDKKEKNLLQYQILMSIKPPQYGFPESSEIKKLIEESSPQPKSFTNFLLSTYSAFNYFQKQHLLPPTEQQINERLSKIIQPIHKVGYKAIVFDIDETLILCQQMEKPTLKPVTLTVKGKEIIAYISLRPHLHECLETLSKHFELIAFTAGTKEYASPIINLIDPERKYFDHVFTRNSCIPLGDNILIKDLRIFGRDLHSIAIVDNCIISFMFQLDNGIPIYSYDGSSQDNALKLLTSFLIANKDCSDIRKPIIEKYRLRELTSCKVDNLANIMEFYESDDEDDGLVDSDKKIIIQRRKSERIIDENLEGIQRFFQKRDWNLGK